MNNEAFLDAAIAIADIRGRFDHRKLSKQLKITKARMGVISSALEKMGLVITSRAQWRLVGAAQELSAALHARNIDQQSKCY